MFNPYLRYKIKRLREYIAEHTADIDHRGIIRNAVANVELSGSYLAMLLLAGVIALLGLLTNSVAVVIGAMLISPLMGPIISLGLAFTIGDLALARKGMRSIAVSVVLTIVVTTLVAFISPLNEPTSEILARVRPNIYDLFVAMLAGTAGAVALCTRINYLITATGVAVATAVIPPLSVVGFGLGSGRPVLGLGGFLLFFTNFVAIVLTADLVFYLFNFHSAMVAEEKVPARKRLIILGTVLALISVPLVYTLVTDLRKVKLNSRVERILKSHLNHQDLSHLTGFSKVERNGGISINASINTVNLYEDLAAKKVENELATALGRPVKLKLEQVLVTAGGVEPKPRSLFPVSDVPVPVQREESPTIALVESGSSALLKGLRYELEPVVAPFGPDALTLRLTESSGPVGLMISLRRDYPLSTDEHEMLRRLAERELKTPVDLSVTLLPFLPSLSMAGESLSSESVKALGAIEKLPGGPASFTYSIGVAGREEKRNAAVLRGYLVERFGIAPGDIKVVVSSGSVGRRGNIILKVLRK